MPDQLPHAIVLQGASNFRDMGGWPAAEGKTVRRGVLYRSAGLGGLTDGDLGVLQQLGLRTACDLRSPGEVEAAPSRLPEGVRRVPVPIRPKTGASLRDLLRHQQTTGEDIVEVLRQTYRGYATTELVYYRALFDALLTPGCLPLVFHCAAGKDRTGFAAALVLTALGVERAVVVADYAATERLWNRANRLPADANREAKEAVLRIHPDLLEEALDVAAAQFGGVAGLLEVGLGLDEVRLGRLRELLLV